nr:hypothetical protein [Mycoplasmopsis bovis]
MTLENRPKLSNGSRALKELGIVTKVGPNCTKIKVGDRVGDWLYVIVLVVNVNIA